jgi:tRNA/rRNA methyltransferase
VLVQPFSDHLGEEARRFATHGEAILDSAQVVGDLDQALTDCRLVVATSANIDGIYRTHNYGRPDEVLPSVVETLADGPCALVFGPEPSGLSNAEIARCHGLIRILTDSRHSSLNLSHAVAICLFELRRLWLHANEVANHPTQKVAPFDDQERMFDSLRDALTAIHFLWGTKADSLMHAVRHLIARARPSPNEVRILYGLARQLRWVAANGVSVNPEDAHE